MKSHTLGSVNTDSMTPNLGERQTPPTGIGAGLADEAVSLSPPSGMPADPKAPKLASAQAEAAGGAREECSRLARLARNSFRSACDAQEEDDADAHYAASVDTLSRLWQYATVRDRPFKDLLAALQVALRDASIRQFDARQRDALRTAFADLALWHLDPEKVAGHIDRLTEVGVDLLAPVRPRAGMKKLRITIEEIEE
jgi:hypothetical protein